MEMIQSTQLNSPAWMFFVKASFAVSILAVSLGIFFLPTDLWVKGYMAMGMLFVIGSTFSLAKTLRDEFEAKKLINKLQDARTEKILKEYEVESTTL